MQQQAATQNHLGDMDSKITSQQMTMLKSDISLANLDSEALDMMIDAAEQEDSCDSEKINNHEQNNDDQPPMIYEVRPQQKKKKQTYGYQPETLKIEQLNFENIQICAQQTAPQPQSAAVM